MPIAKQPGIYVHLLPKNYISVYYIIFDQKSPAFAFIPLFLYCKYIFESVTVLFVILANAGEKAWVCFRKTGGCRAEVWPGNFSSKKYSWIQVNFFRMDSRLHGNDTG